MVDLLGRLIDLFSPATIRSSHLAQDLMIVFALHHLSLR